jgi:hypothetical protein
MTISGIKHGDYPVVGKNGRKSFCAWRTLNKTVILNQRRGHDLINSFRLPTEAEWVFCKRRIRVNILGWTIYENDRGCFANFKPNRGDYAADQAL